MDKTPNLFHGNTPEPAPTDFLTNVSQPTCKHLPKRINYLIWEQNPLEMLFPPLFLSAPDSTKWHFPLAELGYFVRLGVGWVQRAAQSIFIAVSVIVFPVQEHPILSLLPARSRVSHLFSASSVTSICLFLAQKFHSNLYLRNSFSSCDFSANRH